MIRCHDLCYVHHLDSKGIDEVRALYFLSIWLHLIAAAIWIGGTVFLATVLVPMIRRPEYRSMAPTILQWAGERFHRVGWASLLVLIVTGLFNLAYRQFPWADVGNPLGWTSPFGQILILKLVLVAMILALSVVHDAVIGPRATAAWRQDPTSERAQRIRQQASWIGRINLLLSLIVVALGAMLVRGRP